MPNKEKYWYLPWIGVGLSALIFGAIGWYIALKASEDKTTAGFTFIIVGGGTIFIYILFIALWDTIHQAVKKKKQPEEDTAEDKLGEEKKIEPADPIEIEADSEPEQKTTEATPVPIPMEKKPTVTDLKLESFGKYCTETMSQFVTPDNLKRLKNYVEQYAREDKSHITLKIPTEKVDTYDLLHFGWNMWKHFKVTTQPEVAQWLKKVFVSLKDVDISTIEHNLKHKDKGGNYLIKIVENIE